MWLRKISSFTAISLNLGDYSEKLLNYLTQLSEKYGQDQQYPYTQEDVQADYQRLLAETQQNMQKIITMVQNSISALNWKGSPVEVKVGSPPQESSYFGPDFFKPVMDAYVSVGGADFTVFVLEGGKIEIDDILEADEEDFFPDPRTRADYFQLIKFMKNPNAAQGNKVLTLYTARPMKDRAIYEGATQVPANIYLTNTYGRAEGIGLDLAGSGSKMRDIWKVRIEEKYLIQTLDAMGVKDYQVIGEGFVPVRNVQLLQPGE